MGLLYKHGRDTFLKINLLILSLSLCFMLYGAAKPKQLETVHPVVKKRMCF